MSIVVKIPSEKALADAFEQDKKRHPQQIMRGVFLAAQRGKAKLVKMSPVDQGQFKNSWRVFKSSPWSVLLENFAPHAGIIERGARPHPVSKEGQEALFQWVKRHNLVNYYGPAVPVRLRGPLVSQQRKQAKESAIDAAIWGVVAAIVWKLKHKGQKGLYLVGKSFFDLEQWLREEVEKQLGKHVRSGRHL